MRTPVTKIGYILTTFPCRTETFAVREIDGLRKSGFTITVFGATRQKQSPVYAGTTKVFYRPALFSMEALLSISYLSFRYPLALGKLLYLVFKLIRTCPREALSLMRNIHTIGFFAKHFDNRKIPHIHAYFLSWPSTIGMALSTITHRSFSISAHARDIFVEHGAMKLKISHANFVTVCTRQGLEYLKANLPTKYHHKLYLNYHGIRIASGLPDCNSMSISEPKRDDTVIAVGRLIPKKGFENLVRAFNRVLQQKSQYRMVIVGDGPERKRLIGLTEELNLKNHAEFLGWQDFDATLRLIRQSTVLVAPSLISDDGDRDGIPNVILEAFSCGTPVIASRLEGISEAVEHRVTGLLVEPGDVVELASAIEELLDNRYLHRQLSQRAYETVIKRFNSTENTKQLSGLFTNTN
jgi:glycosyltransferase involved in cell wall biosynthesis